MIRLIRSARAPVLMSISVFPFGRETNQFDRPRNEITQIKPLEDELGWDRVKRIFRLDEDGMFTKELQSIINLTLSGGIIGTIIGGMSGTKNTVDNFIANNEATRFASQFDAKRHLQQAVTVNFIKKGAKFGGKLALFCFMFNTITTCTTAYRGKLTVGNYVLGCSVTGLLFKMNLGPRAALVGAGLGGILGGLCGSMALFMLWFSGITMDEALQVQKTWVTSRNENLRETIKTYMDENDEMPEVKTLYEINKEFRLKEQNKNVDHKT